MKINKIAFLIFSVAALFYHSNGLSKVEDKSKLTVEADESLEWFEKEKYYLAKGNVILEKDGLQLKADLVKSYYGDEKGENVLKKIVATNDVIITTGKIQAKGQHITYILETKIALMSGSYQSLSSPSGYIESNESIFFNKTKRKANAKGKVKIILPLSLIHI